MPKDNLFIGIYPGGISYCDRSKEKDGDYLKVAFLPYDTLALKVYSPRSNLLTEIKAHAATMQAQRGQRFQTAGNQWITLGDK